jgi:hypothetical protein
VLKAPEPDLAVRDQTGSGFEQRPVNNYFWRKKSLAFLKDNPYISIAESSFKKAAEACRGRLPLSRPGLGFTQAQGLAGCGHAAWFIGLLAHLQRSGTAGCIARLSGAFAGQARLNRLKPSGAKKPLRARSLPDNACRHGPSSPGAQRAFSSQVSPAYTSSLYKHHISSTKPNYL